jgi:cyclic peptide transporter
VSRDTQTISQSATPIIVAVNSAILVVFTGAYIAILSLPAFLVTIAVLGVGVLVHLQKRDEMMRDLQIATERENAFLDVVTHLLEGFKEVRLSTRRSRELYDDLVAIAGSAVEYKTRAGQRFADHFMFSQTTFYALLAALVFALPSYFSTLPGAIQQVTAAILFIVGPLSSLISTIPTVSAANVAVDNITHLESLLQQMHAQARDRSEEDAEPPEMFREITLSAVRFAYRDRQGNPTFEVGPIDLSIRRNETLFIVGGNGSGKSTFLKLLTGLYYPDSGVITVDGRSVAEVGYARYRNMFSAIFSDYHLFDRLYGVDASPEQVAGMLADMELGQKTRFVDGRFVNQELSTGQRKRLALIVSLLEDRSIDVFDEWAADQDPAFRERFYAGIIPGLARAGKTIIAATHDDRYFDVADRIVRMDSGRLVAVKG